MQSVDARFRAPLPPFAEVYQRLPADFIGDPESHIRQQLGHTRVLDRVKPGDRIAITAGSRGTGGLIETIRALARSLIERGARPFVIPAMGSHAGAQANGQRDLLKAIGITEDTVGAPIVATMETIVLGFAENGARVHLDREAASVDGIIVVGRTKTHPSRAEGIASGLLKMCVVGLGKQHGAQEAHNHGLWETVKDAPKLLFSSPRIVCGVSIVENAFRRPCVIEIVRPTYDDFLEADRRLLQVAKTHLARIPFDDLDVLVVDKLGKNISGTGMDPNVIGHWRLSGGPHTPNYRRLVVLSLTPESMRNGIGIGMADFTTKRFVAEMDSSVTYMNILTSMARENSPREGNVPLACASDREAMEVALYSALPKGSPRICRIKNTSELDYIGVSEALLNELDPAKVERVSNLEHLRFDANGNLF